MHWINLTGAKKVHSLIDKVYKRKNLEMAWERVKTNQGSGGVDGEAQLDQQLDRLQRELKEGTYQPQPVRQHPIPKRDKPHGKFVLTDCWRDLWDWLVPITLCHADPF